MQEIIIKYIIRNDEINSKYRNIGIALFKKKKNNNKCMVKIGLYFFVKWSVLIPFVNRTLVRNAAAQSLISKRVSLKARPEHGRVRRPRHWASYRFFFPTTTLCPTNNLYPLWETDNHPNRILCQRTPAVPCLRRSSDRILLRGCQWCKVDGSARPCSDRSLKFNKITPVLVWCERDF